MSEESTVRKYEDIALLAVVDALEADLGTVRARKKLGVNHRTFANCRDTRQVTRLMRKVLKQCVNWGLSSTTHWRRPTRLIVQ